VLLRLIADCQITRHQPTHPQLPETHVRFEHLHRAKPSVLPGSHLTLSEALNELAGQLVAQITSLQPSGCADCPTRVQNLNAMIPGWASSNSTAASPIAVVDQNTGFNPASGSDTGDGVHANTSGSMKIAAKWFSAVMPLIAP
jgi:hypothetical protein